MKSNDAQRARTAYRPGASSPRLLLVDDDQELGSSLADYLQHDGFDVELCIDGENGLSLALSGRYDIVILDVMLPGITGIDALRSIRAKSNIPVVMLTARGDEIDRVVGLELGADDYVTKPCSARELGARLRAILRRLPSEPTEPPKTAVTIESGPLTLWPLRREADWDGLSIPLTATEFSLLELLMRHAGELVTREKLYEEVLGTTFDSADRSIDVHVSRLRQKLSLHITPELLIKTVRRRGYLFVKH
jgi:two-component system OmpR family response regulator